MTTTTIIIRYLYPILGILLTGFGTFLTKEAVKVFPEVIKFVIAKTGDINYDKDMKIAISIFKAIEEDSRLFQLFDSKINQFETMIKAKIPSITSDEIDLFRQSIASEFNKDKPVVVQAIELAESIAPTPEIVVPTLQ
ncbi:MAG TPA: hypothetical protein VIM42_04190 [Clostridium sp.]